MSKRATTPPLEYASSPTAWEPHSYQKRAVKWLLEHAGAGLFLDPGLGKTSITLAALKILKKAKLSGRTLVIAPLRVCHSVWPGEVEKWKDFEKLNVTVLHGKNKEEMLWASGEQDILCINPEGLEWLFGVSKVKNSRGKTQVVLDTKRFKRLFKELNITDLVVDESTKFKNSASIRFKILKLALSAFQRRWILTGTPAPNGLMDLFGQMFIVDLGNALGQYITHYRKRFFDSVGFGGFNYKPRPGAEDQIYALLKTMVLRLAAKDYLDMPEVIPNPIKFDLNEDARRIYDELEDEFVADVGDGIVTALNAASAMNKCAQVANGGLYKQTDPLISTKRVKGAGGWDLIHNDKDELVADLVEELSGQPVMIAYEFDHDRERLLKVFGKDTPYIAGGVGTKQGKEIENKWNRGEIPVLLVQPSSVSHGLNLQHASKAEIGHIIWYALTYDYEVYDQFIRRVVRQGSVHKRVIVHMLLARDTVDVAKWYALRTKEKGQNALLNALRVYVRHRPRTQRPKPAQRPIQRTQQGPKQGQNRAKRA